MLSIGGLKSIGGSVLAPGATGADLTLSGNLSVTNIVSPSTITITPTTTIAIHGSNFDVSTAGALTVTGNVAFNGARLDMRSGSFTNFTLGTVGNAYLALDMNGLGAGITSLSRVIGSATTATAEIGGVITTNVTAVGNGADTTEDNLMTYSLPGTALAANARGLRITAWGDGVSTADVTTVRCYFGATVVVSKVLTASQANTWKAVYEVMRTGATAQIATGILHNGGTAQSFVHSNTTPAETLSGAVTIKCTGQRATTSSANSVRQLGMIIEAL